MDHYTKALLTLLKERFLTVAGSREFEEFKAIMEPAKELFAKIGVEFDIRFYPFSEFLALFRKMQAELDYLRRYTFD